jgi:DNA mismatch repair ATPase MutS
MDYLILVLVACIVLILISRHFRRSRRNEILQQIRACWAKPKDEPFYFGRISMYANQVSAAPFHRLSDQTIEDIDFYKLFAFVDRTISKVGQQFLFKRLLEPSNKTVSELQPLIALFSNNQKSREEIQFELARLRDNDAYQIPTLLEEKLFDKPRWLNLAILNIVVVVGFILLSFTNVIFLILLIIPLCVNMLLHYWNKSKAFQFSRSLPQLSLLIHVSQNILSKDVHIQEINEVSNSIADLRSVQRKIGLINFDNGGSVQTELGQLAAYLVELLKIFFLVEVFILFEVVKDLQNRRPSIVTLFNYVGNIDTAISIASLRAGSLTTCQPIFRPGEKELHAKEMYHPLIDDCATNDLSIGRKSILITGSNMSGKSTFLRTLMLNSILAQTIDTCFAAEFISPILKQHSSIRIDDNLFQGTSYYFQEVKTIGSLIDEASHPEQNLFVLDEVFKGTNTTERIAAAKAVLSYLNRNNNIVVVATHDIELSDMLKHEYDLYHFTELVENNSLHFDYRIKWGQMKTRNAIRLLELSGYPPEIIAEARGLTDDSMKRL